jgi:hypothetical protein
MFAGVFGDTSTTLTPESSRSEACTGAYTQERHRSRLASNMWWVGGVGKKEGTRLIGEFERNYWAGVLEKAANA